MSDIVERLRNSSSLAVSHPHFGAYVDLMHYAADEIESLRSRLAEIIAYCAQEGNDGEPYDTINAIATGEYSTRGGGE